MALPPVGSPAPDFTLPSTSGEAVTLSALRGRNVLLAFFPAAFTRVCTAEMCEFTEDYGQYEEAGTVVLPISVDAIPSLREFKSKERIRPDLLSDFHREVSRKYGVLLEDKFLSKRAYVLIDAAGVVRWGHEEEQAGQRRESAELLAQLHKLGAGR